MACVFGLIILVSQSIYQSIYPRLRQLNSALRHCFLNGISDLLAGEYVIIIHMAPKLWSSSSNGGSADDKRQTIVIYVNHSRDECCVLRSGSIVYIYLLSVVYDVAGVNQMSLRV